MMNAQTTHVFPKRTSSRMKRPVEVISGGAAFPISEKPPRPASNHDKQKSQKTKSPPELDFLRASQDVRHFGSNQFVGKSKRDYDDEQYLKLTGRKRKKHQVPLPIVRGIKKKAAEREARAHDEAKQAGIVLPQPKKPRKRRDKTSKIHGPAPTVGFMMKGILRVKDKET